MPPDRDRVGVEEGHPPKMLFASPELKAGRVVADLRYRKTFLLKQPLEALFGVEKEVARGIELDPVGPIVIKGGRT